MDEILASIRKIISDDDTPAPETAPLVAPVVKSEPLAPSEAVVVQPASAPEKAAPEHGPLVGEAARVTTASAFDRLSSAAADAAVTRPSIAMPPPGLTLEDVTRELLRPMLKAWLDEHLPAIVQDRVDEEVARIARGRVR